MSLLEVNNLEIVYHQVGRRPVRAVAGVSLALGAGEIVGLVGESGCGKSTLARAVVGLLEPESGSVVFKGNDVHALTRRARDRELLGLQMVFQNPYASLNPRRTIAAQLSEARETAYGRADPTTPAELLERVGLPAAVAKGYPHEFSGGQRQRIALARALAAEPSVIVLDEPLSSLDASAQAQIANLLVELARSLNIGFVLISHDLAIVRYIADRVSVMYLGRIVEEGETAGIWNEPYHPYTRALIGAVPRADGRGILPEALPGEVPDPGLPPTGCRFHPRCPRAFDRCSVDDPRLVISDERKVACWLYEPTAGNEPREARPAEYQRD